MASFRNIYTSLMLVIAGSTSKELARQVSYLKAENQILRSRLPDRLSLTHPTFLDHAWDQIRSHFV